MPVLARQADILRSESEYLDELAVARVARRRPTVGACPAASCPLPLARRAVRQWLGAPPPSSAEVERVLAVAAGDARARRSSPGAARCVVTPDALVLDVD